MQDVKEVFARHLDYVRQHHEQETELEVRIGRYNKDGHFEPGYHEEEIQVVQRLTKSLDTQTAEHPIQWRRCEMDEQMIRSDFGNGIRLTSHADGKAEYICKTVVSGESEDVFASNRPMSFRVRLSREEPLNLADPTNHALVKQKAPLSVRAMRRRSYIETAAVGSETVVFRYDVSKVSNPMPNKKQACDPKNISRYHVELELVTKLLPLSDKECEAQQNQLIAESFLHRTKLLLGSFAWKGDQKQALLPVQLSLVHESQRSSVHDAQTSLV